jgi:hypothetical protein
VQARPGRLRAVLDDRGAHAVRDRAHLVDRPDRAVEVDRDDGARAGADDALERGDVDRGGVRVRIAQDRPGARARDRRNRRHAGVGLGDDLVAGPGSESAKRELDGVGPGGDPDGVAGARPLGELVLERPDLFAQHEPAGVEYAPRRLLEVGALGGNGPPEVRERDVHDWRSVSAAT